MSQYTQTPYETSRTYDRNGDLAQNVSGTARSYGYDYRNQLVQFSDPGAGQTATYKYDALGRRIEKTLNGVASRFYYEGDQVRLQPANVTMQPIYKPASDIEVQGKVLYRLGS